MEGNETLAREFAKALGTATVTGEQWRIIVKGKPLVATIQLDPAREPKEIDFVLTDVYKGKSELRVRGIYRFVGNTLQLSVNPTGDRPKDFVTKADADYLVIVTQRKAVRDEDRLQGAWRAVGGAFAGEKLLGDDLQLYRVRLDGDRVRVALPPKGFPGEGTLTLNPTASPKQLTVKPTTEGSKALEGIYRFDGEQLVVCIGGGKDPRPKEFKTEVGKSYGLLVLEREPVPPDQTRMQGTWKVIGHEEGGEKLQAKLLPTPDQMSITFTDDRVKLKSAVPAPSDLKVGPKTSFDGVLHLDPTANPKRISVYIPGDNRNSVIGIYRFDGERLVLCLAGNPTKLDFPSAFATKKGDGLVMLTLDRK
jgi:uncharacterized protein (TIGR03067 family)